MRNPVKQLTTTDNTWDWKQLTTTDSETLKSNASKCPGFLGFCAVDDVEEIERLNQVEEFFQLLYYIGPCFKSNISQKSCFTYQQLGHECKQTLNQTVFSLPCFQTQGGRTPIQSKALVGLSLEKEGLFGLSGTALKFNLCWNQFEFQISISVSCWSNIISTSVKSKNDISTPEVMQTRLCDKMSSPSHRSFSTAMLPVAMQLATRTPLQKVRIDFEWSFI